MRIRTHRSVDCMPEMRQSEERFANALATGDVLVVADGPLNISQPDGGRVVGFVKRLFRLYLGPVNLPS